MQISKETIITATFNNHDMCELEDMLNDAIGYLIDYEDSMTNADDETILKLSQCYMSLASFADDLGILHKTFVDFTGED